jgi:hypothetical protein
MCRDRDRLNKKALKIAESMPANPPAGSSQITIMGSQQ